MASVEYTSVNSGRRSRSRSHSRSRRPSYHNNSANKPQVYSNSSSSSSQLHHSQKLLSSTGNGNKNYKNSQDNNGTYVVDSTTAAAGAPIPRKTQSSCCRRVCGCKYSPSVENLEYDYAKVTMGKSQPPPRIRARGEYYIDSFNGEPWTCSFGTGEENGIWMNSGDQAGSVMAALVWILMIYSAVTVTSLTITEGIPSIFGMIYSVLVTMALASHAKTSLTDPGSVPKNAVPLESQRRDSTSHSMCGQCQTFKPPFSHHCRICNRCVSRMDHHCPWMNNCVGAGNLKHFFLFLIYTWTCSAYALTLFGWNYFFCADEDCTFRPLVLHLVRVMTILCFGAFLFTSSMLMNVTYGLMTGIGTIDRLKKKATNTMSQSDEEPIPLEDVFGIGGYHTWLLPVDPVFEDFDTVVGFTTPQRLAREQQLMELKKTKRTGGGGGEVELSNCVNDFLPV